MCCTQTGGGRAVTVTAVLLAAQLRHHCLLMCGPIREFLNVVWAKKITVVVWMEGVRVIITRT